MLPQTFRTSKLLRAIEKIKVYREANASISDSQEANAAMQAYDQVLRIIDEEFGINLSEEVKK